MKATNPTTVASDLRLVATAFTESTNERVDDGQSQFGMELSDAHETPSGGVTNVSRFVFHLLNKSWCGAGYRLLHLFALGSLQDARERICGSLFLSPVLLQIMC